MSSPRSSKSRNISDLRKKRNPFPSAETLFTGIIKGDLRALSRGITLIESTHPSMQEEAHALVEHCLSKEANSLRIGITGVPGAGKSSFIEALGKQLTSEGKKVAVLAVDPSSTLSKGSILADKTRMPELVKDPMAFIRPSPSGNSLGGVARKTRESISLCEAAGFNIILVETVGVGQSETAVHGMVDFFLLLKISGAGDEIQGIKRGIMEMADAVVINKADGDNLKAAERARQQFESALHLFPPKENGWVPAVLSCSALDGSGIPELRQLIHTYGEQQLSQGHLKLKRRAQNKSWLLQTTEDLLKERFYSSAGVKIALEQLLPKVEENEISPFRAARLLLSGYRPDHK